MQFEIPPDSIGAIRSCQVQTPNHLADAMVSALGDSEGDRWLEPCVGQGRLLTALATQGIGPSRIRGLDLDPELSETDRLGDILRGADFLAWANTTDERFDKIVANPPYLPLSKCPPSVLEAAINLSGPLHLRVRPCSNCWSAFLMASLKLLKEGGGLCFVLPAAWEYADYAAELRKAVAENFQEMLVYRSLTPLFAAVQEGSVVLLARGFGLGPGKRDRIDFESPEELIKNLRRGGPEGKTGLVPRSGGKTRATTPLGEEIIVSIGAVTGDNSFFLLSEARRLGLDLPHDVLRPVVTRARHLTASAVDRAEWRRLRDAGERVWLFRPEDQHLKSKAVRAYLSRPEAHGGCRKDGYKISRRSPWHRTPLPSPAHGFLSGMTSLGPWIALNRMRNLTATNTLYTVRFRTARSLDARAAWALALLTTEARASMRSMARRYADGLRKFEPGDLRRLSVPTPTSTSGTLQVYEEAISALVTDGPEAAALLADQWFIEQEM